MPPEHEFAWQTARPQLPQLLGSRAVSTQSAPQRITVAGPVHEHTPPAPQVPAGPQSLAQEPQWRGSVARLTQLPPHIVLPPGQTHAPAVQVWPSAQRMPQLEQLFTSFVRFTHIPGVGPHTLPPDGQAPHTPPAHVCPAAQRMPHALQLFGSEVVSTQALPHEVPEVHTQLPPVHMRPAPHTVPHVPQLLMSVAGSMQPPLHIMLLAGHVATQAVPAHKGVAPPQTLPHVPQCAGLSITRTHALPQSISLAAQPLSEPTSTGTAASFALAASTFASGSAPASLFASLFASTRIALSLVPTSRPASIMFCGVSPPPHPTTIAAADKKQSAARAVDVEKRECVPSKVELMEILPRGESTPAPACLGPRVATLRTMRHHETHRHEDRLDPRPACPHRCNRS